jgi:hypothetical protein
VCDSRSVSGCSSSHIRQMNALSDTSSFCLLSADVSSESDPVNTPPSTPKSTVLGEWNTKCIARDEGDEGCDVVLSDGVSAAEG